MNRHFFVHRLLLAAFGLLALPYCLLAQTAVKTVIPALPGSETAVNSTDTAQLAFSLTSIPANAIIDSGYLRLTLRDDINGAQMVLVLYRAADKKRIDNLSLHATDKKDATISIKIRPLLIPSPATPFNIRIYTPASAANSNLKAFFYSPDYTPAGTSPRIVVYYHLPENPVVEWAGSHADQQHSGHTISSFAGSVPKMYRHASKISFSAIQSNLVLYKGLVYVIDNSQGQTRLYATNPLTKTKAEVAAGLPVQAVMPTIDNWGRMYYTSSNWVQVIDLEHNGAITNAISLAGTITTAPTVAKDGSLYLVFADGLEAYSPYPEHKLLWKYPLTGKKSAVTLNREGTIAYIASYANNTVIALNTENSQVLYTAPVGLHAADNEGATIPVVTNDGYVYVANRFANADSMFVFDSRLNRIQSISGSHISQPAYGKDSTVYFTKTGALVKCYPYTAKEVAYPGNSPRSVLADMSNNAYLLYPVGDNGSKLNVYIAETNNLISTNENTDGGIDKAMVIGADGILYTCTSNDLLVMPTDAFNDAYILQSNKDEELDNTTFRGSLLEVPASYTLKHRKILVGQSGVSLGGNVQVSADASITVTSGGGISFKNGFTVKQGATFSCKTGYGL